MTIEAVAQSPEKPTYDQLEAIARAAVGFHRSLMADWAAPRTESQETLKRSDALEEAYGPFLLQLSGETS